MECGLDRYGSEEYPLFRERRKLRMLWQKYGESSNISTEKERI